MISFAHSDPTLNFTSTNNFFSGTNNAVFLTVLGNVLVVSITMYVSHINNRRTINEMVTQRESETLETFRQLKREAYTELLASLEDLTECQKPKTPEQKARFHSAGTRMNLALARIDVVAPMTISKLAESIEDYASVKRGVDERESYLNKLSNLMREDLGIEGRFEDAYIRRLDRK